MVAVVYWLNWVISVVGWFCSSSSAQHLVVYIIDLQEKIHLLFKPHPSCCNTKTSPYGTIIRTEITCEKILFYMLNSAAGDLLLKKLKYFEVILNIFEFLRVWRNAESWLVFANRFWITQPYFSTNIIKQSHCQLFLLLRLSTLIISLNTTKKNQIVLFTLLLRNIMSNQVRRV